jgi:hypothetical protein
MAQPPVSSAQGRYSAALSPLVFVLLLLLYGAGMMALPIYFFGATVGLWLSSGLFAGGVGVVVVLCGSNREQEHPRPPVTQSCVMRVTPAQPQPWVRPRIIPFQ